MEILQTRVMRGPNYWSDLRQQLVVIKVKLKETDLLPSSALATIGQKLESLKPAIHNLSPYQSIVTIVAQVAIEMQCLAGMDCVYYKIHPTANPLCRIICFSYTVERAGIYAAKAAVNLVNALISGQKYQLEKDIHNLRRIQQRYALDEDTQSVVDEALSRNIPVKRLGKNEILLGYGAKQHLLKSGEYIFPIDETAGRIPVVAVTGTNGKTTITRLIAYFAKIAGYRVGYTTTDGIYIHDQIIAVGDCGGPLSAAYVLKDPKVNFAVLECARGGILKAGLGFDKCQVSIVTNISNDHLGMDEIETLAELAKVKFTVVKATTSDGYAILNADDDLVYQMKHTLTCKTALFSLNPESQRIIDHCKKGNLAAVTENGYFMIWKGKEKIRVAKIKEVPLCHSGKSECMIQNVLPALLTAYLYKISVDDLEVALKKFLPTPDYLPGRMNVFNFGHFNLMIDYAHNEAGYLALKKYADQLNVTVKVGVIAAVASRPDKDIINLGRIAAGIFDEIIIRHDAFNNGRTIEELNQLLYCGIKEVNPGMPVLSISNEFEAIKFAIDHTQDDSWIFVNSENVYDTVFYVSNYKTITARRGLPQVSFK